MEELAKLQLRRVSADTPPLTEHEARQILTKLPDWKLYEKEGQLRLEKVFKFKNYKQALDFTNRVAEAADLADHHPAILTEWGKVTVTWWTHTLQGLHQNDFILAARTEELHGGTA